MLSHRLWTKIMCSFINYCIRWKHFEISYLLLWPYSSQIDYGRANHVPLHWLLSSAIHSSKSSLPKSPRTWSVPRILGLLNRLVPSGLSVPTLLIIRRSPLLFTRAINTGSSYTVPNFLIRHSPSFWTGPKILLSILF